MLNKCMSLVGAEDMANSRVQQCIGSDPAGQTNTAMSAVRIAGVNVMFIADPEVQ